MTVRDNGTKCLANTVFPLAPLVGMDMGTRSQGAKRNKPGKRAKKGLSPNHPPSPDGGEPKTDENGPVLVLFRPFPALFRPQNGPGPI